MTYAAQRDAIIRTRQDLVVVGVRECQNHYGSAGNVQQLLQYTEQFDNAVWTSGPVITANAAEAPDGTMTADSIAYTADTQNVRQTVTGTAVTSKAFTGSWWIKSPSGSQQVTIRIRNVAGTESSSTTCAVTTTWQRFWSHKLFSGTPVDDVRIHLIRLPGDATGTLHIWGANLWRNPGDRDYQVKFPYVKREAEAVATNSVCASRCTAADAGNGSRCYFSRPTCQDVDNFNAGHTWELEARTKGIREFRFCRHDAPLPYRAENIMPYLVGYPTAAQEIDPERSVTINERATFEFEDDTVSGIWNPVQSAEGSLVNTATGSGTFWRRFSAIYHNWSNPECYLIRKAGYVESGASESDYQQRGKYIIQSVLGQDRRIRLVCSDRLKLTRKTIPAAISDTNLVLTGMATGTTTIALSDVTEVTTPGDGYTVTLELEPDTANAEYVNVTSVDTTAGTCVVTRGRWGTTAIAHNANVAFREVYQFGTERATPSSAMLGKNPINIVLELYAYAGLSSAEIDTATLTSERDTWLYSTLDTATGDWYGPLLKRTLSEQVDVEDLLREIRELCLLSLWVNESQVVTGKLYAPALPGVTLTEVSDDASIIAGTFEFEDDKETRISRVLLAYDLMDGDSPDTPLNFRRVVVEIDIDAEEREFYGEPRVKAILSEWLQDASAAVGIWREDATARYFTSHMLARYRHGLRLAKFRLEVKDDAILLGDFIRVSSSHIQDAHGNTLDSVMQVIKKAQVSDNVIALECLDTGLLQRVGFWAPNGLPDYSSATDANKEYMYWGGDDGVVGSTNDPAYVYW